MFNQNNTLAIVIDIQEKLIPVMHQHEDFVAQSEKMIHGLNILNIPIIITEQYPKGLGKTIEPIKVISTDANIIEKTQFSAITAEVQAILDEKKFSNIIVLGCETHVCVLQTVLTLREQGFMVYLPKECVASRSESNKNNALQQMMMAGTVISNIESILFQLLGDAKHPSFKLISKLIQ